MVLREWLEELDYELLQGTIDVEVSEVVYDSRKAKEGTVFVAMRGANVDAHDFIPQVIGQNCKVIVSEKEIDAPADVTVLKVANGRSALSYLSAARFGYPARKMTTIGVTGTKGKTTTTYMIQSILEAAGQKTGVIGTNGAVINGEHFETKNTTPESYILQEFFAKMVDAGCKYMVMEVSSQSYLMHRVDGIHYDYSLFLNISNDHIGPNEHKDFDEYLDYKKMLLQNSAVAIVNRDDEHFDRIIDGSKAEIRTFSLEKDADYMCRDIEYVREHDFVGIAIEMAGLVSGKARISVPGKFNAANGLAAFAICSNFDIDKEMMLKGLENIHVNGRMEIAYKSAHCSVIVDYAHNAVSMESLLKTLRDYNPERLVVVFGCGGNRAKDRRYSMGEMGGRYADLSIITADNSRFEEVTDIIADIKIGMAKTTGKFIEIPDRREAIEYAISNSQKGDMIAIIGKGHEDYQEIKGVRYPFLDRAVVEDTVKKLGWA